MLPNSYPWFVLIFFYADLLNTVWFELILSLPQWVDGARQIPHICSIQFCSILDSWPQPPCITTRVSVSRVWEVAVMFGWASQRYAISVDQCRVGNTTFWYFVCWQHVIQYFGKHLHVRTPTRGKKISPPRTCCGCMSQDFSDRTSNWTRNLRIWNYEPCTFVATCRDLISMPDNCGGYDSTLEIQSFSFLWPFEKKTQFSPLNTAQNAETAVVSEQNARQGEMVQSDWLRQRGLMQTFDVWLDAPKRRAGTCIKKIHPQEWITSVVPSRDKLQAGTAKTLSWGSWLVSKSKKKTNVFFLHEKNDFCGKSFFMPRLKHRSWAQWPPPETLRRLNTPNIGTINDNHTFKLQTLLFPNGVLSTFSSFC